MENKEIYLKEAIEVCEKCEKESFISIDEISATHDVNKANYAITPIKSAFYGDPKLYGELIFRSIQASIKERIEFGLPCRAIIAGIRVLDPLHRYIYDTPSDKCVPDCTDEKRYIQKVEVNPELTLEVIQSNINWKLESHEFLIV